MKTGYRFHRVASFIFAAVFSAAFARAELSSSDYKQQGLIAQTGGLPPVSLYVQDGLVALYDGIENAGPGLHNPNATTWADLSGHGNDLVQYGTNATPVCMADGFFWPDRKARTTFWCGGTSTLVDSANNATMEIAGTTPVGNAAHGIATLANSTSAIGLTTSALGLTVNGNALMISSGGSWMKSGVTDNSTGMEGDMDSCGYFTVTRSGTAVKMYNNGRQVYSPTCGSSTASIGHLFLGYAPGDAYYERGLFGKVNGFRVYNRALSQEEIKWNRLVDRARFAPGPQSPTNIFADTRSVGQTFEHRVRISSGTSGRTFTVNGGVEAYTSYDAFVAKDSAFSVAWSGGASRLACLGLPSDAVQDASGCSFTVTAPVSIELEAFTPTHVWTGGDGSAPDDFATAGNWRDNAGGAVAEAPGAASSVFIPAPAAGETLVKCSQAFAVAELRLGRLSSADAGSAVLETGTLGTNTVSGVVRVFAGGTLRHKENPNGETVQSRCNLEAGGDMTVEAGGEITAKALGYARGYGYGGSSIGYGNGSHPSHGGVLHAMSGGGYGGTSKCYGSVRYPVTYGSASKSYGTGGTRGGGAIYLKTAGALRVDGAVDASAGDQNVNYYSGAGGSVQIHARTLLGRGRVWANGGQTSGNAICGSGGRIAVYATGGDFSSFAGTIRTWGGRGPSDPLSWGCCGTVYLETAAQGDGNGDLVIDNGGYVGRGEVEFNSHVTDAVVGRVRVKTGGKVLLCSDGSISVRRGVDASCGGAFNTAPGSRMDVEGSEDALFAGTNTLAGVTCTVPDKTIRCSTTPGDYLAISDGGSAAFTGEEGHLLNLYPDLPFRQWIFHVGADATVDAQYVSVSNSNAGSGVSVLAISSANRGGNVNWGFSDPLVPGALITWTGAENDTWGNIVNWNPMRAPMETDRVLIPAGCPNYPLLTAGTILQNKVTVESGAALTLAGGNLAVTNGFTCAGTFTACGCETLFLTGPENTFAGATVNAGNGTVRFEGDLDQTFDPDGATFAFLTFRKSGGNMSLTKGLTARAFEVTASAPGVFSFAAGETFTVSELYLNGAVAGEAALTVKSTTDDSAWKLVAGSRQQVSGVIARDSDASGGETIRADALSSASDAAGDTNWIVGGKAAVWSGGASGKWNVAANWTPNGVPDGQTRVTISADAGETVAVTIDKGVTAAVSNLLVGAGRGTVKLTANAPLVIAENLEVATNATAELNAFEPGSTAGGDLLVRAGGKLTHAQSAGYSPLAARIELTVGGAFLLEKGAVIDLVDRGFQSAPWGTGNGTMSVHGGRRPVWGTYTYWSSWCVGSVTEPKLPGYGSHGTYYGGGAVWIAAGGEARVDGDILADSRTSSSGQYYTGSGGSVYLSCSRLTGAGLISASAKGVSNSLGGSGGRIAVHETGADDFDGFTGTMRAYGGWDQATPEGAPGTIYTCTRAQAAPGGTGGDLWIRNGGGQNGAAEISQQMGDTTVGNVHIASGCALVVHAGRTLTVNGDFLNDGTLTCSNDSTVVFATTNSALVRGANAFYNLTSEAGDKTIRFAPSSAGNLVRVKAGGTLTLSGADKEHPLSLLNAEADKDWALTLDGGTEQHVQFVTAARSDASGGSLVVAKSSTDGGNNVNWNFPADIVPGEEITWTGAVDADFGNPLNWDRARAPEPTDRVIVAATANDPVLTHDFTGNDLTIQSGAAFTLNGANLTLTNDLRCAGTLAVTDRENVRVAGNVNFAGGAYVTHRETFTLTGEKPVTVDLAGQEFNRLAVAKTGGRADFTGPFTADTFAVAADGALTLAFAAGEMFTVADLITDGGGALTLESTTAETAWRLAVTRRALVSGVTATDSDASAGLTVHAEGASVCTRCVNWSTGVAATRTWTGGTGSFTDEGKWDPAGVPGENDRVVVPSGTVTIPSAATVRGVTVGGGETAAGVTVRGALTVTGSLEALTNGTLTLDAPVTAAESLIVRNGGKVTHSDNPNTVTGPSNELYKVVLEAGVDVIVDEGGKVTADGCGYRTYRGPGTGKTALHAGSAGEYGYGAATGITYGSIVRPVTLGSGGQNRAGGGAIRLTAAREVRVEGAVTANGGGTGSDSYYTGAGGSVWITAGVLTGAGRISADGMDVTASMAGTGGRVALHLTEATDFSAWKGEESACGGRQNATYYGRTGAGTLYRKARGWKNGTVTVWNRGTAIDAGVGTVIPSLLAGDSRSDLRNLVVDVKKARLTVTNDVKIADLTLSEAGARILSYRDLTVKSSAHRDGKGWAAEYPACETRSGGQVRWGDSGFLLLTK